MTALRSILSLALFAVSVQSQELDRNLIHNASFEVGLTAEWGRTIGGGTEPILPKNIDGSTAYHGNSSLHLPAGEYWSKHYHLNPQSTYLLGFAVRGPAAPVSFIMDDLPLVSRTEGVRRRPLNTWSAEVSSKWKLHEFEIIAVKPEIMLRFILDKEAWLDAVYLREIKGSAPEVKITPGLAPNTEEELDQDDLETGEEEKKSIFKPRSEVEAGIYDGTPGHVFHSSDPIVFQGQIANYSRKAVTPTVDWLIRDIDDNAWQTGRLESARVEAGKTKNFELKLEKHPHGIFSLVYHMAGDEKNQGEYVYSVVPKPQGPSVAGYHTHLSEYTMQAWHRSGVRHYASLTDTWSRFTSTLSPDADPRTHQLKWYDDKVNLLKKYNISGDLCILPNNWGVWTSTAPVLELGRHPAPEPDYEKWNAWIEKMASHYKDEIDIYYVGDEIDSGYTPERYLNVVRNARSAILKGDPGAKILVSASGPFFDRFLAGGGDKLIDILGGSTMGDSGGRGKKMAVNARRYNKQVYSTGGFSSSPTFYHTHGGNAKESYRATYFARQTVRAFFEQRADACFPYIGRLIAKTTWETMPYNHFEWDGSLKRQAMAYVITGMILGRIVRPDTLEPTLELPGLKAAHTCYPCELDGKPAAVIQSEKCRMTLPIKSADLQVMDWLWNPVKTDEVNGQATFEVGIRTSYLIYQGANPTEFSEALLKAGGGEETKGALVQTSFYYRPKADSVELVARAFNEGSVASTPSKLKFVGSVEPGEAAYKTFEVTATLDRPLPERTEDQNTYAWLANAPRTAASIDGNLDEWQHRSPNTIYVTWDVLAYFARRELQAFRGQEYITHDWGRDFKIYFWCGWDDQFLFAGARVNDQDLHLQKNNQIGDHLEIQLSPNFMRRIEEGKTTPEYTFKLRLSDRDVVSELNDEPVALNAIWKRRPGDFGGYDLEVAIPWKTLGTPQPLQGQIMGLDFFAHDVDSFKGVEREHSILRWAGASSPSGQMLLTSEKAR